MKIYLVGAGPGDVELITVKGQRLLKEADLIVFTGSLVNPRLLDFAKPGADLVNSASLSLPEIIHILVEGALAGKLVVRLQTGDPSLYGAVGEQIEILASKGIEVEWVPGVSSFLAGAARLQKELTVPGGTQTVILTRAAGLTPVPEAEDIATLAETGATLVLYLSVDKISDLTRKLLKVRPQNTPVAVVYKATFPDEKIILGDLSNIAEKVFQAKISRLALIYIGEFLTVSGQKSLLYDPDFSHGYRWKRDGHED